MELIELPLFLFEWVSGADSSPTLREKRENKESNSIQGVKGMVWLAFVCCRRRLWAAEQPWAPPKEDKQQETKPFFFSS